MRAVDVKRCVFNGIVAVPYFNHVMSNYSHPDVSLSLDTNGDTASVTSSESTEANSDSKADLGLCRLCVFGLIHRPVKLF